MARIISLSEVLSSGRLARLSAISACVRTVASGVRTRWAASAMKSSDRVRDVLSLSIKRFSDVTSDTISAGTGATTGRRSFGPRRDTDAARFWIGRIVLCAVRTASKTATVKNPSPIRMARFRIAARVALCPARVCASDPRTSTGCPSTDNCRLAETIRTLSPL